MISSLVQKIIVGAAAILIAGFIIWLTVVASTLSAIQVELTGIHQAIVDMKQDTRRELDSIEHRVEKLEARR